MPLVNRSHKGLLDSLAGKTSVFGALASAPALYLALSTTTPTMASGNFTEPSGNAYARKSTAASDWVTATSADPSVLANANELAFPEASGSWGTITYFGIYDASSAGNLIAYGALSVAKAVTTGDVPRFQVGELTITIGS